METIPVTTKHNWLRYALALGVGALATFAVTGKSYTKAAAAQKEIESLKGVSATKLRDAFANGCAHTLNRHYTNQLVLSNMIFSKEVKIDHAGVLYFVNCTFPQQTNALVIGSLCAGFYAWNTVNPPTNAVPSTVEPTTSVATNAVPPTPQ